MSKEELVTKFKERFPIDAGRVKTYEQIGPRVLAIKFKYNGSMEFLYIDESNWQYGYHIEVPREFLYIDEGNTDRTQMGKNM